MRSAFLALSIAVLGCQAHADVQPYKCAYVLLQANSSGPLELFPESKIIEASFNLNKQMYYIDGSIAKQVGLVAGVPHYGLEQVPNPNDPVSVALVFSPFDDNNQPLAAGTWAVSFGYGATPTKMVHGETFVMTAPVVLPNNPPKTFVRAQAVVTCTTK